MSNEKALLMQGFFVSGFPQCRRSVGWRVEAQGLLGWFTAPLPYCRSPCRQARWSPFSKLRPAHQEWHNASRLRIKAFRIH